MDKRIRKNDVCIINLPRCDYVFSSTRTCFIAYGFADSPLEMEILTRLLRERQIEAYEAASNLAPGQYAFCTKICSKIITSQFCIVLLNHSIRDQSQVPNANVNMEYGLMLGFNKYVVPFQREDQALPFNVAGLDTIKYNAQNFAERAGRAIDIAIHATEQKSVQTYDFDQGLSIFLFTKNAIVSPISNEGDRNIFELGRPLGFNLLTDFSGLEYRYFGNFPALRADEVSWRIQKLVEILDARLGSVEERVRLGAITEGQIPAIRRFVDGLRIWILTTSPADKVEIENRIQDATQRTPIEIFTLVDIEKIIEVRSVVTPFQATPASTS